MARWLMKSEPDVFSYADLEKKGVEEWHGVRNYAARNHMKAMQPDDLAFFYHSNIGKQIVGIMRVVAAAHPDSTAELKNGRVVWECVDVVAHRALPRPVTLETIKMEPALADMALVKLSRLSVQPVTSAHWAIVCALAGLDPAP